MAICTASKGMEGNSNMARQYREEEQHRGGQQQLGNMGKGNSNLATRGKKQQLGNRACHVIIRNIFLLKKLTLSQEKIPSSFFPYYTYQ